MNTGFPGLCHLFPPDTGACFPNIFDYVLYLLVNWHKRGVRIQTDHAVQVRNAVFYAFSSRMPLLRNQAGVQLQAWQQLLTTGEP